MANHSRWCSKNPKRVDYINSLTSLGKNNIDLMNIARKKSGNLNHFAKAKNEGKQVPIHINKNKIGLKGTPHTEKTKQILKEKALSSKHRRLKKGTIKYKEILLDSSWELELAKRLDEQNIAWIRPNPLSWIDETGITHNYFPDFYLPDYNIFLDPKNPQALKVQKKKINCLLSQYTNIIIIDSLDKCKTFTIS